MNPDQVFAVWFEETMKDKVTDSNEVLLVKAAFLAGWEARETIRPLCRPVQRPQCEAERRGAAEQLEEILYRVPFDYLDNAKVVAFRNRLMNLEGKER